MTPHEYVSLPRVVTADHGVWLEGIGLLTGDDAARLVGWLASAVKKHRKRQASAAPAVTIIDGGVDVAGLGCLSHGAALALAHRLADALSP